MFKVCSEDEIDYVAQDSLDLRDETELILLPRRNVNKEKLSQLEAHPVVEEKLWDSMHKTKVLKPLEYASKTQNYRSLIMNIGHLICKL